MARVLGAIFSILGFMLILFVAFDYLNSSAYLNYNAPKLMLNETGMVLPFLGSLGLIIVGLIFLILPKDK